MKPIEFIDRKTGRIQYEEVYFGQIIDFLYGPSWVSRVFGGWLAFLICRLSFVSVLFGWWNRLPLTKNKIRPFVEHYRIDPKEFVNSIESFSSFDDFFIRKLKKESRPIAVGKGMAILPADARYLFYPNVASSDGFIIKGEKFDLKDLLQNEALAKKYIQGTLIIARLCPTDYHRYHFPIDCLANKTELINGYLYSVNPAALKKDIHILTKNKRTLCELDSKDFGKVLFIEVGATNVGSIHQTYTPGKCYQKGEEKGYFSFGGSTLILLFEPGRLQIDEDLLNATAQNKEIRCLMGERLGIAHGNLLQQ